MEYVFNKSFQLFHYRKHKTCLYRSKTTNTACGSELCAIYIVKPHAKNCCGSKGVQCVGRDVPLCRIKFE